MLTPSEIERLRQHNEEVGQVARAAFAHLRMKSAE
jgi:hypothetical protein